MIAFDRHPYQPLIYAGTDAVEIKPVVLENEGERDFVLDLRKFCEAVSNSSMARAISASQLSRAGAWFLSKRATSIPTSSCGCWSMALSM